MRQLGPGDQFGNYRIEQVAGRGGMGLVYRARQSRPDRTVAIKVIAPELAADRDFRARFEQESTTAAQIEHPNVIPVYEVGEESGLLYIVMRFVQGVDLGQLLAQYGRLEPGRTAHLISQVAAALDAAHAHGLVHRDVKPGNVLVTTGDDAYLTDFGLTKRIADSQGPTRTGMFVGTIDYVAPEQIEGGRIDARADIYSLGCVTYELLSGNVPFARDSELAKLYAHVNDEPPPLTGVPAPLAAAVARAMAKRPEERFNSAGDLGRAVAAGAAGRVDQGTGRIVATGDAAIAGPYAPTELAAFPPTNMPTQPRQPRRPPPDGQQTTSGGGEHEPRWRLWAAGVGVAAVVAAIVVAVVLVVGPGGNGQTTSTTTTTTTITPPKPNLRAVLPPATVPPEIDECRKQLMFAADGTAGPVKCSNGDVNILDWNYIAKDGHTKILSLGRFASPQQVFQAMCQDHSSTIPLEIIAYQLAQTYYQWNFAVDPSSGYPGSCP